LRFHISSLREGYDLALGSSRPLPAHGSAQFSIVIAFSSSLFTLLQMERLLRTSADLLIAIHFTIAPLHGRELFQAPNGGSVRWADPENVAGTKGGAGLENKSAKGHAFDSLKAGQSITLMEYDGCGIIRRIWITISDRSPEMLRSLTLAIYWEGLAKPAVLAPLGDFFGIAHGQVCAFENALFSNPEGRSFNCLVPMPFRRSARVVLRNDSKKDLTHIFYDVDFETVKKLPKDALYFHCYWSRQVPTKLGEDFQILPRVSGKGRFLGANVGVFSNPSYENSWWGEGEIKMYLDGDAEHPTVAGTGTEDYIGTAWGMSQFANRYQGCLVANNTNRMWAFYRFHIPDPVFFQTDLQVVIQTIGGTSSSKVREFIKRGLPVIPVSVDANGNFIKLLEPGAPRAANGEFPEGWINFYREDDYCATAYFYLDNPGHELPPLPSMEVRLNEIH
jgi:hypothetical protein